jgi:hypothetical protein
MFAVLTTLTKAQPIYYVLSQESHLSRPQQFLDWNYAALCCSLNS